MDWTGNWSGLWTGPYWIGLLDYWTGLLDCGTTVRMRETLVSPRAVTANYEQGRRTKEYPQQSP